MPLKGLECRLSKLIYSDKYPRAHDRPGEAVFSNNSIASMGDLGSKTLKKGPSGATWQAGSSVRVSWGIRYNHGGGCKLLCV
jgi:hypothetical protein